MTVSRAVAMMSAALAVAFGAQNDAGPLSKAELGAAQELEWTPDYEFSEGAAPSANETIREYCVRCHNERRLRGDLSLETFDATRAEEELEVAEKMIRKLRAGMMPPPGARRPEDGALDELAALMERRIDSLWSASPDPGYRSFQRLTRAEYEASVRALLGIDVDADAYLPQETVSAGFDNVADVQTLSATLLDSYLTAAAEVSRQALGDLEATPSEATYEVSRYAEQRGRVPGAPYGTRGGISVTHNFLADGEYFFRLAFQHESTGNLFGQTAPFEERIELSIDGRRVALLPVDRWMHRQDPEGVERTVGPFFVTAGPRRVSAAFLKAMEGPVEDIASPHAWSLADKKIGYSYGITGLAHLRDLSIGGPYNARGVTPYPAMDSVFICRPKDAGDERPCARRIAQRLSSRAFRRPPAPEEIEGLLSLYDHGRTEGDFATGVRTLLQGILASPDFVFRFEPSLASSGEAGARPIGPYALASRLSFFLWGAPPDAPLLERAASGALMDPAAYQAEVERMLDDARARALGTRFAHQWLRLQDLSKVRPDALRYPDFHEQLAKDMLTETHLFFNDLVRSGGTLFDLLEADYTFLNERLAVHYGIEGVVGDRFRKVFYDSDARRGILGHGSILTLTSHANRTSPVLRGKWVMEVLLGTPPPPPPPDVPELDATPDAGDGRFLSVTERLEQHRANPTCNSCHSVIDPIGLALENFDVSGAWRLRDNNVPVETAGELYDGSPIEGPADLRAALLARPEPLARTLAGALMTYALGRRVEAADMPQVRAIVREAREDGYALRSFVKGVTRSLSFRASREAPAFSDLK